MAEQSKEEPKIESSYQFTDDDQLAEETFVEDDAAQAAVAATPSLIQKMTFLKNKRVLVTVGIVVMVVIVYNLLGGNTVTKTSDKTDVFTSTVQQGPPLKLSAKKSLQQQVNDKRIAELLSTDNVATTSKPAVIKPVQAVETPPPASGIQASVSREELQNLLENYAQKNNQTVSDMMAHYANKAQLIEDENKALYAGISELSRQLAQLQATIKVLQDDVNEVNHNQQRIMYNQGMSFDAAGEMKEDQAAQGPDAKPSDNNASQAVKPHYRVQAAVPGRAWLKTDAGETLSITIGDSVPGFGVVVSIDGVNGYVTTSSGVTLTNR